MKNKIALDDASSLLAQSGKEFKLLFETGSLQVELYKPYLVDKQQPHDKDEIYVITEGSSKFILENEITRVKKGDFLFVPAGTVHHFEDFTLDFTTWVFFYGPKGGEKGETVNFIDNF
jgi:oxalate decarboxylase/phosphoglucose isomerase-like protein (cupin superfamily)